MRNFCIFLLSLILFVSCSNKEKEFDENLRRSYEEMVYTGTKSEEVCGQFASAWRTAIWDNKNPDGSYCSDFNDALLMVLTSLKAEGVGDSIQAHKDRMQIYASKMNNPPDSRKDCYNDWIDVVTEISNLATLALAPSGSLQNYTDRVYESQENAVKKIEQFKIKYAALLSNE